MEDLPFLPVANVARDIRVRLAASDSDWSQAYSLVARSYQARGYEPVNTAALRFTPYHALPDTTTVVALCDNRVKATLSLVADNTLLGLPLEESYAEELRRLRAGARRLAEATSLADEGLGVREFLHVFQTVIRLAMNYHCARGGDSWVIAVNPRHRGFYTKVLGFESLGPRRSYGAVLGAPAEAYYLDLPGMLARAPEAYAKAMAPGLPQGLLEPVPLPPTLALRYAATSSVPGVGRIREVLDYVRRYGSPRRW